MLSKLMARPVGREGIALFARGQLRLMQSTAYVSFEIADHGAALRNFGKKHKIGIHDVKPNMSDVKKNSEKSKKVVPAESKVPADPNTESFRARLRAAHSPYEIEAIMRNVLAVSAKLNSFELKSGFEACIMVGNIEMSILVLNHMKKLRYIIPGEYITKVVQKAVDPGQLHNLLKLVQDLTESPTINKIGIEDYLNKLISSLLTAATAKPDVYTSMMESAYGIYLNLRDTKKMNVKLRKDTFGSIANFYITNQNADKCLEIFQDMHRAGVEPDIHLCGHVLDIAISNKEIKVIRVIAMWYSEIFNVPIEYGMAQRILEVSATKGDGQLAIIAFQLLTKSNITPDRMDYYLLVRALIKAKDVVSAVEALQDMESRGVSLIPTYDESRNALASTAITVDGTVNALELYDKILDDISTFFTNRSCDETNDSSPPDDEPNENSEDQDAAKLPEEAGECDLNEDEDRVRSITNKRYALLEDFYFALVDQVEKGQTVPRVVVDAVLNSIGSFRNYPNNERMIQLKRVRSIFDQYPTVFKLNHDITSHVAMITATKRLATFNEYLTLFQEMEHFIRQNKIEGKGADALQQQFIVKEGLKIAYSRLFHFMATKQNSFGFMDIWQHMRKEHEIYPDLFALSRLGTYFSQTRQMAERELVLDAMNETFKDKLHIPKAAHSNGNKYHYIPRVVRNSFNKLLERQTRHTKKGPGKNPAHEGEKQTISSRSSSSKEPKINEQQNSRLRVDTSN